MSMKRYFQWYGYNNVDIGISIGSTSRYCYSQFNLQNAPTDLSTVSLKLTEFMAYPFNF